ncbi:MAG: PD40 domain-containing protein [Bacteroidales bacterium]|nr:PD40 domain-containing protein [Bacteroidales bacterium]
MDPLKQRFITTAILALLSVLPVFSQNTGTKEAVLNGDYYFEQQKYTVALDFYLSAFQKENINHYLSYQIGECYFNLPESKHLSLRYFHEATPNVSDRQSDITYAKGFAPVEAHLRLGEVYQQQNMLDSALQSYLDYKDLLKPTDKFNFEMANVKIQSIAIAKGLMANPLQIVETNLGPLINTRFSDYNPVVSADEKVLVYTSFWESADLIFMSRFENGAWGEPVDITKQLGSDGSFYTSAISSDGKDLYLVEQDDFNTEIYVSHFNDTAWGIMQKLNNKINSLSHESSVSVSADGNTLYFSSNRPGGFGSFDIYFSVKTDGEWDKPQNMGEIINTIYNEEAPYITPDGRQLFFCSEGHRNMGGMDIFYCTMLDDNNWTKPQNAGYPLNTTGDNLFYIPLKNGEVAYISKNGNGTFGRNDIYRIDFPINDLLQQALTEDEEMEKVNLEIESVRQNPPDTAVSYTVQIMALRKNLDVHYFKEFNNINVYECTDILYRFVTGNFSSFEKAKEMLGKALDYGYRDAFIRTIKSIPGKKL